MQEDSSSRPGTFYPVSRFDGDDRVHRLDPVPPHYSQPLEDMSRNSHVTQRYRPFMYDEPHVQHFHNIKTTFFEWNSIAYISIANAILINLDLHYIPGGILTMISVLMMIAAFGFSVYEQWCFEKADLVTLYKARSAGLWTLRLLIFLEIPFLIWVIVLMFERANNTGASCNSTCTINP